MLAHNSCYGLGAKGLRLYAEGYGVEMDAEEAQRVTDLYRDTYPEIKEAWNWLRDSFIAVIEHREQLLEGYGVRIYRDTNFLFMELPSGRRVAYFRPRIEMQVPPWEREKAEKNAKNREAQSLAGVPLEPVYEPQMIPAITYMGLDQYTRKWVRQTTHGGKILENICQAGARDILATALVELENNHPGIDPILHVHDEIGILTAPETAPAAAEALDDVLSTTPVWAPGLLLGAEGGITKRYRKM